MGTSPQTPIAQNTTNATQTNIVAANIPLQTTNNSVTISGTSLANFPKMLLTGGLFDGYIVVAENASNDILTAADLVKNSIIPKADYLRSENLETGVDLLGSTAGEDTAMNNYDLPTLLATRKTQNALGTYNYTQTLFLPNGSVDLAVDRSKKPITPKEMLIIDRDTIGYNYKVTFMPAIRGKHKDGVVDKLQGMMFNFLGKDYALIGAEHRAKNNIELEFVSKDAEGILKEDESAKYIVNGKEYEVQLLLTSTTPKQATFIVNGEVLDPIDENSFTIIESEGLVIGVKAIYEQEPGETTGDMAHFFLGNYVNFRDSDTTADDFNGVVTVNNHTMRTVHVNIGATIDQGVTNDNEVDIAYLEVQYTTKHQLFIDKKFSTEAWEKELEDVMFLGAFEIENKGLLSKGLENKGSTEDILLYPADDHNYNLKFTNKFGKTYDRAVLACIDTACSSISYGRLTSNSFKNLTVNESKSIEPGGWFFLSFNSMSHMMQLDAIDTADQSLYITDLADTKEGEPKANYRVSYNSTGTALLNLDDGTYSFRLSTDNTSVTIDMDSDKDFTDTSISFKTKVSTSGGITFSTTDEASMRILFRSAKTARDASMESIYVPVYFNPDSKLDINRSLVLGYWRDGFNMTGKSMEINGPLEFNDSGTEVGMTEYGLRGELSNNDDLKQSTFKLTFPISQLYGYVDVYSNANSDIVKKGSSEDFKMKSLVLLGNACTNKMIAELEGNPQPCLLDLAIGKGYVKSVENAFGSGRTALIVEGFNDTDVVNAAKAFSAYKNYTWNGSVATVIPQKEFSVK